MPFSNQHPDNKPGRRLPEHRIPKHRIPKHRISEVAERALEHRGQALDITFDTETGKIKPLDTYKVFLKRNLKWQTPPADLLSSIHARIDSIKEQRG